MKLDCMQASLTDVSCVLQNFLANDGEKSTGFLPLSLIWLEQCFTDWLPTPALSQIYAIMTKELCPPEGFVTALRGEFVVSRQRILAVELRTYKYLLVSRFWVRVLYSWTSSGLWL